MYEKMVNEAIQHDIDIVVCQIKTINTKSNLEKISQVWKKVNCKIYKEEIENKLIPDILTEGQFSIASSVNKIYKKDMLKNSKIKFDESLSHGEDARFNLLLIQDANSIEFIDKPLYKYYIRDRVSLTRIFNKSQYKEILDNKNFGLKLCKKYNILNTSEYSKEYLNNTINFIESLIRNNIDENEKKRLVLNIIKSKEFRDEITNYDSPSLYYYILKKALMIESYILIKIIILGKKSIYRIFKGE